MPVNDFDRGLIDKFEGHDFEYNPANWERLSNELPVTSLAPVNAFDRALVEKFDGQQLDYDAANWKRLEKILPETAPARKRRPLWLPLSGIAAALALLISGVVLWNRPVGQEVRVVANGNKIEAPASAPAQATNVRTTQSTVSGPVAMVPGQHTANPQSSNRHIVAPIIAGSTPLAPSSPIHFDNNGHPDPINAALPNIASANFVAKENAQPVIAQPKQQFVTPSSMYKVERLQPERAQIVMNPVAAQPVATPHERFIAIDPDEKRLASNKLNVSLAGGYNQGTTNGGYMVGMNARKNIGSKVYVEGDVALASSRNAQQTLSMPANDYDAFTTFAPNSFGTAAKSANTSEPVTDLYYLQVTPVVGYQVLKNLSFGAGADVQRMLRDREKEVFVSENLTTKPMPTLDMGVVAKTEYTIYKSVKAGVQYRHGMNEVLAPSKNYTNRSYLQVQLKVGILGTK